MAILHNRNVQASGFDPGPGLFFYQHDSRMDFAAMVWVTAGRSRMRIPPAIVMVGVEYRL
jgi:hypothetical protein